MRITKFLPPLLLGSMLIAAPALSSPTSVSSSSGGYTESRETFTDGFTKVVVYKDSHEIGRFLLNQGASAKIKTSGDSKGGDDDAVLVPVQVTSAEDAKKHSADLKRRGWNQDRQKSDERSMNQTDRGKKRTVYPNSSGFLVLSADEQQISELPAVELSGYSAENVYDSNCLSLSSHVYWHGCYTRSYTSDRDPNNFYSVDRSQATGHGTWAYYLKDGNTEQNYNSDGLIVQWDPDHNFSYGDCHTVELSLEFQGVGVKDSFSLCKAKIESHISDHQFHSTWVGLNSGGAVATASENLVKIKNGKSGGFYYSIHDSWSVF